MSTLKVVNIQHPDDSSGGISLSSDGTISAPNVPVFDSGTGVTNGVIGFATVTFNKTFSSPPKVSVTKSAGTYSAVDVFINASNVDNTTPEVSTTEFNVTQSAVNNIDITFQWIAIGE